MTTPFLVRQTTIYRADEENRFTHFGNHYDLRVFLTIMPELRRQRVPGRPAFLHQRFFEEWTPMEHRIFSPIRAVPKAGNTYSIPPLLELSDRE